MGFETIVTSIEKSILLKEVGYNKKALLSHYENKEGHKYVGETGLSEAIFIAYAYTTSELTESLPSELEVDTCTYVADFNKYSQLTKDDIEQYQYANLVCFKIDNPEAEYGVKYCFDNRVIAFGLNTKGEYKNLITFDNSEANSRANIIIMLIEEGKLNI